MLHAFIYGLKDRVRAEVRLCNPAILTEAAHLVLDFDELMWPDDFEKTNHSNWRGNVAPSARRARMGQAHMSVGFTPAWVRGTSARGTRTCERYRPHYSSTSARALLGTLRKLVVFSL